MAIYRYIRILSLDVVAGACISSLFIAKVLGVSLPWPVVSALGITVWIIYTIDHLIDARNIPHDAHSLRHRFHQKHARSISFLLIGALVLNGGLLFLLPPLIVRNGALLAIIVLVYFVSLYLLRRQNLFFKEMTIGVIYTAGLFLGPLSLMENISLVPLIPLFLQFLGLSLVNLLLFSLFEKELDDKDGHSSLVQSWGEKKVRLLGFYSIILTIGITLTMLLSGITVPAQLIILFMSVVLFLLLHRPALFRNHEVYRVLGDGIFLLPVLLL